MCDLHDPHVVIKRFIEGWPEPGPVEGLDEVMTLRGLEMKGWLRVDAESVSTKRALEPWVMESVAFARALPPKKK
jgi:hypothetical protein